jgi:site-specific DNA-methyltransferase (adenine-specific)
MPDNSVDAVVTDPPYGLSFMGKRWDYDVPSEDIWRECLRVLKPGGHLLAFAGTRTQHRMAVRIEDAGFEIRDMIAWVYGSGFPKSLDVSKALDKMAGAEREIIGKQKRSQVASEGWDRPWKQEAMKASGSTVAEFNITAPATSAAKQWQGWGTALKPALEPITVARKPFTGTVAANVLQWGTGGVNVDGCRVGYINDDDKQKAGFHGRSAEAAANSNFGQLRTGFAESQDFNHRSGRFPANLIHDGSDEVVGMFPETGPSKAAARGGSNPNPMDWGNMRSDGNIVKGHNDNGGSAARFFYCAKASKRDRDEGCEGMPTKHTGTYAQDEWSRQNMGNTPDVQRKPVANHHPTVKPTDLMRYLCRLVTPQEGTVLDPFMGSGSTGKAAVLEGFNFIGIEREPEYLEIARARITHAQEQKESRLI